ncbi:MAG: hypothetical protein KJ077_41270 [Anaerolineae bacterium]|nr:hypothetical protein [Anaerolineae bacterium]
MTELTFKVDVSRTYRNKTGYKAGGYKLNSSFKTETHTPESFKETVIKEGWPYTMAHLKRSPQETGAAARGVKTAKHRENFISRQELTADDDSKAPGVIDFWLHDPFFARYGWAFVESVNSRPGVAEKGHPTLIFDRPITDPKLYKLCAKAFIWHYPRVDKSVHNIDRTIYNAQNARVHWLGHICPFEVFEREILEAYRAHLVEVEAQRKAAARRRQAELRKARQEGRLLKGGPAVEKYLQASLDGIFDFVARQTDNRHAAIFWAGTHIGALEAVTWSMDYRHLFDNVELRVIEACHANGYIDHPNGGEQEILRTFNDGRRAGATDPVPEPEFYENWPYGSLPAQAQPTEATPKEAEQSAIDPLTATQHFQQRVHQLALPAITSDNA